MDTWARVARRLAIASALLTAGCAQQFGLPMTAIDFSSYDSGPALVAYLGQPDASPAVCDLRARGPHLTHLDDEVRSSLVRGLVGGKIAPELWRRCAGALLRSAPTDQASSLLDAVGKGYRTVLKDSDFEKSPALQARLQTMQRFYVDRKNGVTGHANVDDKLIADLRRALDRHRLGPVAARFGSELVDAVDLEHGSYHGRLVDLSTIDALFRSGDAQTLLRFSKRLSAPALRDEARRRAIRLNIAASPYLEVRAQAAAVEATMMKLGKNPIALAEHPPVSGWLAPGKILIRGVLVRQEVWKQTATLLGYSGDRPGLSVLPEVKLRGALLVEVQGISKPVTLCGPAKNLDPSPCVSVKDVKLENPDAYLDKGGAFHFVDHIAMRDAVNLAQLRNFLLPVSVGGRRLLNLEWRLSYERPENLIFTGPGGGGDGPPLGVGVDHRDPARFIFTASTCCASYLAVVESADLAGYHVASVGGVGMAGSDGSPGASGSSGGECEDGGDGGDGGRGGDGGPGGNGGNISVQLTCGGAPCQETLAQLQSVIASDGGAGGAGGAGGSAGSGGSGGSAREPTTHVDDSGNTVIDDPGCSAGSDGRSGSSGSNGAPGPDGRPGRVSFSIIP